jgi:ABC-type glycerol-3-phosphate transport system substrate-binding protein
MAIEFADRIDATSISRRGVVKAGLGLGAGAALGSNAVAAQEATPAAPPVVARDGDEVSFSYLRPTWGPATFTKDGPFQQQLEELGKARIEVQIIPVIDFDTKINTILASGEIPDVIWGSGPSSQIWKDAQDQGAFTPINDYLEQFPAVKAAVPQPFWDLLANDDGDIFFIPQLIYPIVPFSMFYRKDVFDARGLTEPASLDEFIAVCEELTGDPEMSPFTMGYTWHSKDFATVFDFAFNGWQPAPDDANVILPWFVQEKQRDLHFWFQDMYKRQLLDQNYGLNPEPNLSDERFEGGKSAICMTHWGNFPKFTAGLRKLDPNAEIGILNPLSATAGTRSVFPVDRGFFVSSQMEDPEGFFSFLEWTLTEGTTLRRYGIEGKTFNLVDGMPTSIPDVDREEAYRNPQIEPVSFIAPMSEKLDWVTIQSGFEGAGVGESFEYVKEKFEVYAQNQFFDYRNTMIISPTDGEDGTRLYEDYLRSVVDSVIINADRTPADWDAAVQSWREAGGDQIIDEVNELQTDKSQPDYGV